MIHWCCSIVDSAAARSTPARGARRFRQSHTFSNRSMSSICPDSPRPVCRYIRIPALEAIMNFLHWLTSLKKNGAV
jgi:hypothetical protein